MSVHVEINVNWGVPEKYLAGDLGDVGEQKGVAGVSAILRVLPGKFFPPSPEEEPHSEKEEDGGCDDEADHQGRIQVGGRVETGGLVVVGLAMSASHCQVDTLGKCVLQTVRKARHVVSCRTLTKMRRKSLRHDLNR